MAHEIESTPWHGLGRRLNAPPTVQEGIVAAGLDWRVEMKPLVTIDGAPTEWFATVRETDGAQLGCVGSLYQPYQNIDAFQWFQPFLDSGLVELRTAGSLAGGRRVWILAKIVGGDDVVPGDPIGRYLLLANSHDGKSRISVGYTPIRVVCANTLAMAVKSGESEILRVSHRAKSTIVMEEVRKVMHVAVSKFKATAEQYRRLAKRGVKQSDLEKYVRVVFDIPEVCKSKPSTVLPEVLRLFEEGRGQNVQNVAGTAWAAYNAVTEYLSYYRSQNADLRLGALWFGAAKDINAKALNEALKLTA